MDDIRFHQLEDGRRIAFRMTPGEGPALVFLPGYKSDMSGGKACAVFDWARAHGRAALLLDYSGCGQSDGDFADGTLSRWKEEVIDLSGAMFPGFKLVLVGSSMGGWLMQLLALDLGPQVHALVGLAAAPGFTDWGLTDAQKALLEAGQTIYEENAYGPEPTPTHPGFYKDARALMPRLAGPVPIRCPVRLIHGQADPDVPWQVSLSIAEKLQSADIQVTLVKDGDHRLSREQDIDLLLRTIAALP
jgi:pimeloyl-ACP methyl ester carboxylesterase